MIAKKLLLGATMLSLATSGIAAPAAPVVDTTNGPVRGVAQGKGGVFRGIPFGASTGGANRWQPPKQPVQWAKPRDAIHFGPMCSQPAMGDRGQRAQSEDCLSINVATPSLAAGARLPVLVHVYGGAFFVGANADGFDEAAKIYNDRGVIVVAMNYRLGRFGFFSHPGINAEQPDAQRSNYWLMDQIAGLEWVKANIGKFGGDPSQVTIMGCSAGGSSINSLVASPVARGLFARASAHSGGGIFNATRPQALAEEQGIAFAQRAGVTGTGADAIAKLRQLDPTAIMAADPGAPNYGAVVDGTLLPEEISVAFAKGDIARVPMITGSTSDEASIFGLMGFDETVLKDRFGIDMAQVRPVYDPAGKLSTPQLLREIQTDFIFTSAATAMSGLAARWQPSWSYHFSYVPPAERGKVAGAPHCADFGYTLGSDRMPTDPESAKVAETMQGYWTNFIKTGNPNGPGLPQWPEYRGEHRSLMMMGETFAPVADYRKAQLTYWQKQWADRTGQSMP